ncbi:hypothetical protein BJ166DRAFT_210675 [Pestalotiopsis sp. NC0098]|nr:hypothetical protein BJ166DRAFT_210675 [Pestalotiopsis sp. NC0098]
MPLSPISRFLTYMIVMVRTLLSQNCDRIGRRCGEKLTGRKIIPCVSPQGPSNSDKLYLAQQYLYVVNFARTKTHTIIRSHVVINYYNLLHRTLTLSCGNHFAKIDRRTRNDQLSVTRRWLLQALDHRTICCAGTRLCAFFSCARSPRDGL